MAGHDIGHLPLSHLMEKEILSYRGAHEDLGKRIMLEDSGVNKKRPWYSFLLPGRKNKQNTGDYNKACFRTI